MSSVCPRVHLCVPCVSRLPPVSFYRWQELPRCLFTWQESRTTVVRGLPIGDGEIWAQGARAGDPLIFLSVEQNNKVASVSQSVSYFTVPPRAHPSTGSQSGTATPGLTQVPSTRSRGLLNCRL